MQFLSSFSQQLPLTPQQKLINHFQTQEQLKCDPFYVIVKLALVPLFQQKIKTEQSKQPCLEERAKTSSKITLSFNESFVTKEWTLNLEGPGIYQKLSRTCRGNSRAELTELRPYFIKFLRWFDYKEDRGIQTILKASKKGMEILLEGYENLEKQMITITQIQNQQEVKIHIPTHNSERDSLHRILRNDINLLDKALKKKSEEQQQEFDQLLDDEEKFYFPIHQYQLAKPAQKIDDYMFKIIQERWSENIREGLVRFLKDGSEEAFNCYDSIEKLISENPSVHLKMQQQAIELLSASLLAKLPNYSVSYE